MRRAAGCGLVRTPHDESLVTATAPDEALDLNAWWIGDTVAVVAVVMALAASTAGFAWLSLNGGGAL